MIYNDNPLNKFSRSLLETVNNVMEKKTNKHGHDAVGQEDADIDNDGDVDGSDKYLHNRRKAIAKSMKKEEVEEIDELSKGTLGSYVKKANDDTRVNARWSGLTRDPEAQAIIDKRHKGIKKAVDRLTKEEVEGDRNELVELSANTLRSYTAKARGQLDAKKPRGRQPAALKKTLEKRQSGLDIVGKKSSREYEKRLADRDAKHSAMMKDLHSKLPGLIKSHGYTKVHSAELPSGTKATMYQKPHEGAAVITHVTHFQRSDDNDYRPVVKFSGSGNVSSSSDDYRINKLFRDETPSTEEHLKNISKEIEGAERRHSTYSMNEAVVIGDEMINEALDAVDRYTQHHTAIKGLLKSISEHVDNHKTAAVKNKSYALAKGINWSHVADVANIHTQLADIHDRLAMRGEYAKSVNEAKVDGVAAGSMDDAGHLCATKVFHKEWAEGTPIFSQHAEPDADGDIDWYDVMFEHGIEKRVMTEDLEILEAESHEHHGKRKMKEDVEAIDELSRETKMSYVTKALDQKPGLFDQSMKSAEGARKYYARKNTVRKILDEDEELDEARGRPRKVAAPVGTDPDEPEPRQHIMQQLARARLSMKGGSDVTFKDGSTHNVPSHHAQKIIAKYFSMQKPADKEEFQKKIGASHAAFKQEL